MTIRFTATGKIVARAARAHAPACSRATAPLPRQKLRATNRARYIAEIGKQKSLRLKLVRRMLVSSTTVKGGKVTIAGRVVRPLGAPVQQVVVKRRLSCGRYRVVKRFTPPAERALPGHARRARRAARRPPTGSRRGCASSPATRRRYPTFTLPRYVDLAQ